MKTLEVGLVEGVLLEHREVEGQGEHLEQQVVVEGLAQVLLKTMREKKI
jgi:hypothetical protein